MNWSDFASIGALVVALAVAIGGLTKGKAESFKIGGETYTSYQAALNQAQDNYDKLSGRFDKLEERYNAVVIHNGALVAQLVCNQIVPVTQEEALRKYRGV